MVDIIRTEKKTTRETVWEGFPTSYIHQVFDTNTLLLLTPQWNGQDTLLHFSHVKLFDEFISSCGADSEL